ncbi:fusaric acid resistance protein region [Novosphingobium nitrogenifigens DSM 19370]|uniref:Fusaric acid resistance protein region n=1 Tax=Novosphingobium nitrogenifigens DSM 19370 TaxID=983920 RepID=F1Z6D0_9SPHN|nr:FUSC family protein [Novosphingobium nitrogenifigens]EGD59912.1 fusaric acid resistance protein region [Novosphingobium nitrogenifigens DSM 19370]
MTFRTPAWWPAFLFSFKNALAALIALGFSLSVGLEMPFWAITTVYIVSSPVSAATRSKTVYRAIGTVIGAAAAVAMVPALVEWPSLLSFGLAAWVGGCLAFSLLDRSPRSYTLMLAGYTAAIIGFPSVNRPEAVFDVAQARVTEIVLGITCATVVHSLLLPQSLGSRLGPRLDAWLRDAESWLLDVLDMSDDSSKDKFERDRRRLAVDALDCVLLSTHVPYDTSHWREANRTVQALLYRMLLLLPLLSGLADRRGVLGNDPPLEPVVADAHTWLENGSRLEEQPDFLAPLPEGHTWRDLLRESFLVRLEQVSTILGESRQLLDRLEDPTKALPHRLETERVHLRLTNDPGIAMLSGFSAALGLMLICAFWIITGWPDGASGAAMTAVFCCLFAAMDNPVPMILAFGGAIIASIPLAGIYLFGVLPRIDGFPALCAVLLPPMLGMGMFLLHPRRGPLAVAFSMGFFTAIALQQEYSADLARFINSNLGQVLAVAIAATVTATLRKTASSAAIDRLARRQQADLARFAAARTPPDPALVLGRASDQLALITQRLGEGDARAVVGLNEVRIAANIASVQQLRAGSEGALRNACGRLLRTAARHFARSKPGMPPPPVLLALIDRTLRLTLDTPPPRAGHGGELIGNDPANGRAALVALRRNLFPDAPDFVPEPEA